HPETLQNLRACFGIETTLDNESVASSKVVLIAVKPQVLDEIADVLAPMVQHSLVISIAAGKTIDWLTTRLETKRIVRFMPNLPASVGMGTTAVSYAKGLSNEDKKHAFSIAESFGWAQHLPEDLFDVATAVAGSSPAFVFMFIDALARAGIHEGMPAHVAYDFARQAVLGSAQLAFTNRNEKSPDELKTAVCSPGGTTIEGVSVLESYNLFDIVQKAISATVEKSRRL
ncbi:MAG: pyrroline-5-carboxylate reductase, partial [Eggerthellaceae bacterium]|nr:pyrroline-5-carboxylate reductase [Eggerthellaceae bacterium]